MLHVYDKQKEPVEKTFNQVSSVKIIVFAPNKPIAQSFLKIFMFLSQKTDFKQVICCGGETSSVYQNRNLLLQTEPSLIVGTPGRIKQLLSEIECINVNPIKSIFLLHSNKFLQNLVNED